MRQDVAWSSDAADLGKNVDFRAVFTSTPLLHGGRTWYRERGCLDLLVTIGTSCSIDIGILDQIGQRWRHLPSQSQ